MLSVLSPLASAAESHEVQVANDVASAKELPRREARPGRRVNAAGKLQGGKLRENCVKGALEHGLAGGERGVVACEASSVASALEAERRDAGVPASKLRCDEGLGGKAQQGICYLCVYVQRRVQPVHREEQGGQRAGVRLPRRAASRAAVVTASRRAAAILESTSEEVSTVDCRAYAVSALASAGGLQPRDGGVPACELGGQRRGGDGPQESVGHLGVHLQRRDAMSKECWSTTVLRP